MTVAGRLSDIFGRRYFFLTGAVIIFVGSIVAATGTSINQMIASGVIFGIGSGFLEMSFGAVQVNGERDLSGQHLTDCMVRKSYQMSGACSQLAALNRPE